MKKIPKSAYTSEFKAQAVKHAQAIGLSQASRELGVVEQTLRNWLKAAAAGKIGQTSAPRVTPEQLTRLRAENVRLQMHVEILLRN